MSRSKCDRIPRQNRLLRIQDLQDLKTEQKNRIQDLTAKKIRIYDLQDPTMSQKLGSKIRKIQDPHDLTTEQI